jgi:hypothetical protein
MKTFSLALAGTIIASALTAQARPKRQSEPNEPEVITVPGTRAPSFGGEIVGGTGSSGGSGESPSGGGEASNSEVNSSSKEKAKKKKEEAEKGQNLWWDVITENIPQMINTLMKKYGVGGSLTHKEETTYFGPDGKPIKKEKKSFCLEISTNGSDKDCTKMEMKKLRDGNYRLDIYHLKAFKRSSGRGDYLGYETRDHLTFYADHPDDFINMIWSI